MARKRTIARAFLAIGGVLFAAQLLATSIAKAADYVDPQWPNIEGEPGYIVGKSGAPRWPSVPKQREVSAFTGELGLRYWYSWGKTQKYLYGISGAYMVSRLTYDNLDGHSGEAFGRLDHTSGFFLKGYAGLGILPNGSLNDEDFPPAITPYSSTDSRQREGHLAYASIDAGFNLLRQRDFRLGIFGGYHYLEDKVSAYGCQQLASNPNVCGGGIPESVLVISQNNRWQSLRVGADADIRLSDRLTLRLDAAWLPYVSLSGTDFHWLRMGTAPGDFTGGLPEDGTGRGYQLEASLSYAYSPNVSFGIGGRYWSMKTSGDTHFENRVVGFNTAPQPVDWKTEHMGVFVQGSFKFGPYVTGRSF